jgi:pyruvate,phosphate dikinase
MSNSIYRFGKGINTGMFDATIVGGKGAKLAEMGSLGLPVPAGVTISTAECNSYLAGNNDIDELVNEVLNSYESIATDLGYMPLVSVRSGARVSMPGMMDTILNVGINNDNMSEWIDRLGSDAAADCYKRLIMMYSDTVIGIPAEAFEGCSTITAKLARYEELTGDTFPQAIEEQLAGAIEAVFNSWNSERARAYRSMYGHDDNWGTAVNVQQMVFGNRNDASCSGVLFSRDFNTGSPETIIDWLPNAQGEDVVAGTHTPLTKLQLIEWNQKVYDQLGGIAADMETHYNDMQDMEFTVDNGDLYILQTRDGKRSALAAFTIANDFMNAGKISQTEMFARVTAKQYIALSNPSIDPSFDKAPCATGVGASGSIVTGIAVTSSADAVACKEDCILVTEETHPQDFPGMAASVGILTRTGGITSHAAVVARGMDKTCVVGAEDLTIMGNAINPSAIAGKMITMDGATGRVWIDQNVPVVEGQIPEFVNAIIESALKGDTSFLAETTESVSKGQTAYVDVSTSLNTQTAFAKTLKALKATGGNGVISFGKNQPADEQDNGFLGYFGITGDNYDEGTYLVIEKVLAQGQWTNKFKSDWTLHLPAGASVDYANVLRSHGWKVVTVVNCFKAALSVDGYVIMDSQFADQLSRENMNFGEIETLVKAAGREVLELPTAVTKARRLFDVLGG